MKPLELIARRSLAYTLDILVLFLVLAPLAFLVERLLGIRPQTSSQVWMAAILSFSIPAWSYFTASDMSASGATLGKRLLGVRVVLLMTPDRLPLGKALARTAVKLLPWELAHVFGFALAGLIGESTQVAGLIAANLLILVYMVILIVKAGRQSLHDLLVGTEVRASELEVM